MTHIPQIKYSLIAAMVCMTAVPHIATAQSSAPLSGLYACEAITDMDAQLRCFRSETAKLRAAETSGEVIAVEKETFEEIKEAEVEAEVEKQKEGVAKSPKTQTFTVKSTSTSEVSRYIRFTLDNGEVWQQAEKKYVRLGKANPDMLTIKRGALGSFRAKVNDKSPSFRIKKIK